MRTEREMREKKFKERKGKHTLKREKRCSERDKVTKI